MSNIAQIVSGNRCTGCLACLIRCPKSAIAAVANKDGFIEPRVLENCIDCSACSNVCPVCLSSSDLGSRPAIATQAKDMDLLKRCTSGGFVTTLATYLLEKGYIAFGAMYSDEFRVLKHRQCSSRYGLEKFCGSKYFQSDTRDAYEKIILGVKSREKYFYVGTPCQVAGLKMLLGSLSDYVIMCDFVCRGVPSPLAHRKYCDYLESRFGAVINDFCYRQKTYGYHGSTISVKFANGRKYEGNAKSDQLMKAFFDGYSTRMSCHQCPIRGGNNLSDFTVYECWRYSDLTDLDDNDLGRTSVLINTERGFDLFDQISNLFDSKELDYEKSVMLDGFMSSQDPLYPHNREAFFRLLNEEGFGWKMKRFLRIKKVDEIKASVKRLTVTG